jgi:hypothetical protein
MPPLIWKKPSEVRPPAAGSNSRQAGTAAGKQESQLGAYKVEPWSRPADAADSN